MAETMADLKATSRSTYSANLLSTNGMVPEASPTSAKLTQNWLKILGCWAKAWLKDDPFVQCHHEFWWLASYNSRLCIWFLITANERNMVTPASNMVAN